MGISFITPARPYPIVAVAASLDWPRILTPANAATAGETLGLDPANVTVTVLNPPAAPGTDQNEPRVVLWLPGRAGTVLRSVPRRYGTSDTLITFSRLHQAEGEP